MAAPDPARPADDPPAAGAAGIRRNLFLDSEPEGQNAAIPKGPALDGTPKQCYNAVTTTVKSYLFLSSSPSVRRSEHCFGVPSRVAGIASFLHICDFQGSNAAGSPRLRVFINHLTLPLICNFIIIVLLSQIQYVIWIFFIQNTYELSKT